MTMLERPQIRYKRPWDRASQNKKRLAELRARRVPYIYFFRCRKFIKIGWTTDVEPRLCNIQMANPDPVTLAALMHGGPREEAVLHGTFILLSHRAEWFREEGHLAHLLGIIRDREPSDARAIAGDWLLQTFGLTTLLSSVPAAQKPDQGLRIPQESA